MSMDFRRRSFSSWLVEVCGGEVLVVGQFFGENREGGKEAKRSHDQDILFIT